MSSRGVIISGFEMRFKTWMVHVKAVVRVDQSVYQLWDSSYRLKDDESVVCALICTVEKVY